MQRNTCTYHQKGVIAVRAMSAAPVSPIWLKTTPKHSAPAAKAIVAPTAAKTAAKRAAKPTAAKHPGPAVPRQQVAEPKAMPQDQIHHKGRKGLKDGCMDKWVGWGRSNGWAREGG